MFTSITEIPTLQKKLFAYIASPFLTAEDIKQINIIENDLTLKCFSFYSPRSNSLSLSGKDTIQQRQIAAAIIFKTDIMYLEKATHLCINHDLKDQNTYFALGYFLKQHSINSIHSHVFHYNYTDEVQKHMNAFIHLLLRYEGIKAKQDTTSRSYHVIIISHEFSISSIKIIAQQMDNIVLVGIDDCNPAIAMFLGYHYAAMDHYADMGGSIITFSLDGNNSNIMMRQATINHIKAKGKTIEDFRSMIAGYSNSDFLCP